MGNNVMDKTQTEITGEVEAWMLWRAGPLTFVLYNYYEICQNKLQIMQNPWYNILEFALMREGGKPE